MKPKYREKAKLCYKDTDSFTVNIKTEDIYVHNTKDVEMRVYTSKYGLDRPIPKGSYWINEI